MNREVELVHALADGEVTSVEEAEAKRLVESDPKLRAEFEWAKALKSSMVANCKPIANDEAWKRCVGRLDDLDRVAKAESFVGKWAWVFCGALLLMIFAGGIVSRTVGSRTVSSTQIAGLLDPTGAGLTDSKQAAPDVKAADFVSLSGFTPTSRITGYLDNRPFVRFGLRDQLGLGGLAVVMIQGADRIEGLDQPTSHADIRAGRLNEVNAVTWPVQGNTCILFGERPIDELVALAQDMMK